MSVGGLVLFCLPSYGIDGLFRRELRGTLTLPRFTNEFGLVECGLCASANERRTHDINVDSTPATCYSNSVLHNIRDSCAVEGCLHGLLK